MLELEAVDARSICLFDIEIVGILVERIDDPDPEWLRVSEGAEVDAVDVKVGHDREVTVDLEQGVDAFEILAERAHFLGTVCDGLPERGPPLGVDERRGFMEIAKPLVAHREIAFAPEPAQVGAELINDRIARLLLRRADCLGVGGHGDRVQVGRPQANPL